MSDQNATLKKLVDRVIRHQQTLGLSDNAFCARFRDYVGQSKTWVDRLKAGARNGTFSELRHARWIASLNKLVMKIDGQTSGMTLSRELPITRTVAALYEMLCGNDTDRRVAWIVADYSCGKSWAMRSVHHDHAGDTAYVEADETWRENRGQICKSLLSALQMPVKQSPAAMFDDLASALSATPKCIFIDEAQHGGLMLMKVVKSLVNKTRASFFIGTYPTALRRLETRDSDSSDEARQVLARSLKPISRRWAKGVDEADVRAYLVHVAEIDPERAEKLAVKLAPIVRGDGNLRQLADGIANARVAADDDDPTDDDIIGNVKEQGTAKFFDTQAATKVPVGADGKGGAR